MIDSREMCSCTNFLFRTPDNHDPLTFAECHQLCYNTQGCNYFSIGVTDFVGICIGCTEEATLSNHVGFNTYELTEKRNNFPTASPIAASTCLIDAETFTINGCDFESFVQGLDGYLAENQCGDHDALAVLESLFPNSSEYEVKNICAEAWDNVPTSTFQDVDRRFTNEFMENYINGGTFLNHKTGTFQGTEEGANIASFRGAEATNTAIQPISSLSTCQNNAIMCCFGRDRQPNDDNGNCAEPIETNCRNADPADNSNLCWTDTNITTFDDPFTFPGKSEGPIHCHGLAWGDDDNSFEAQLRFNNLFFVSLYDHMYTRGYVEPSVDSDNIEMCDCVENMPVVSRADCTQVDVTQTFTITYNNGDFSATHTGALDVNFNACQGIDPSNGNRENNDLGSYVYRLNQDGKISDDTMEGVFETLVGYASPNNNQNEEACSSAYLETFGEDYPDDVASLKCPFGHNDRLFRTEDNDPYSLEECQALCYETQFCEYFSIGLSTNRRDDFKGVCIGCTASATLEAHKGFNSYEMTSTQSFPTATPTPESEYFDAVGTNKKCPHDTRLFRTPESLPLSRQECYERCYDTEGCEYFSLGEDTVKWMGVCMGCTADSVLSSHVGFNAFKMEIKKAFPTSAPTQDSAGIYELVELNKKCPLANRLFRTDNYSNLKRHECYERCNSDSDCEYFTYGEDDNLKNAWRGLCIGCSGGTNLSGHTGFNTYVILP